jgi:DNA-directed RNA polymerase specialized sigma24 family protein
MRGPEIKLDASAPPEEHAEMEIAEIRLCTDELIAAHLRELAHFRKTHSCSGNFTLELFRRALCERDQQAWAAIVTNHRTLIVKWVRAHPAARQLDESDDHWVNAAFTRFWLAIGKDRWEHFQDLRSVMQYLKLCTHSVLIDAIRQRGPSSVALDEAWEMNASAGDLEENMLGKLAGRELWDLIVGLLPDEKEQLLAYLCFVRQMRPRQICDRHPERFATVDEVYRTKRNLIERLRRNLPLRPTRAN